MHDMLMALAILGTAACAFLLWAALDTLGRIKEPHHGYYGLVGCVVSLLVIQLFDFDLLWWAIFLACFYALADDTLQHTWQVWGNPDYESPIHRWYVGFYGRHEWVRRLDAWLYGLVKSL